MNIGTLTWNGRNTLTDFGVYVSGAGAHNAAEPDVTTYEIPGRNGDLVISNNRWKNIEVVYPAFIPRGFSAQEQAIRNWLRSWTGYAELTDTYDPTHYRLARPTGELEFTPTRPDGANFEIVFDCDPRRFILSGNVWTTITGGHLSLTNPTEYEARPLIRISGVAIGTEIAVTDNTDGRVTTFTATAARSGQTYIDCETQNIYGLNLGEPVNLNSLFEIDGDFPTLGTSGNSIDISGSYTSAAIKPRWCEL